MPDDRLDDAYVPDIIPDSDLAYFRKAGHGERIGWGETPALLIVDMTDEFTSDEFAAGRSDTGHRAVAATERVLEVARNASVATVFTKVNYEYDARYPATNDRKKAVSDWNADIDSRNRIHPDLAPRNDEIVIEKHRSSAFFDTHLASMLRYYGVDTVVVAGMTTSGCVRATVVDAISHNFSVIVPPECTADRCTISHEVALFDMDMKYADVTPLDDVVETVRSFG